MVSSCWIHDRDRVSVLNSLQTFHLARVLIKNSTLVLIHVAYIEVRDGFILFDPRS